MRKSPWPHTYRTDPGMAAGTVITAINEMRWNQEEWQALRVGPCVFNRFTSGRDGTLWYYRSLAEVFEKRGAPMAALLAAEVRQMEQLA